MKNILLIEDEENLNRGISLKLKKEGYAVFSAACVSEGLKLFQDNTIDLVICDIGLLLWSSFFVTLVAKKIVLINLCCRPCFIWGSITIITVWTNMIIINVCKFFYLLKLFE